MSKNKTTPCCICPRYTCKHNANYIIRECLKCKNFIIYDEGFKAGQEVEQKKQKIREFIQND